MKSFIPFILFIAVWILLYKYLVNKKQKGKIISHLVSFVVSFFVLGISASIISPLTPEQLAKMELEKQQEEIIEKKELESKEKLENQELEEKAKLEKQQELEAKTKEQQEIAKEKLEDLHDELDITLTKASLLPLSELESLSNKYIDVNGIDPKYYKKFFSCVGEYTIDKEQTFTLNDITQWCDTDLKRSDYDKNVRYINKATFMIDFSRWDGSYQPLVEIIKSSMNNPDSFEHVKTMYSFSEGKGKEKPYMYVSCTFRGTNAFNAIMTETISAKVDDETKQINIIK